MFDIAKKSRHSVSAYGLIALPVIVGAVGVCLTSALAEDNCPPGQTDKLKAYKGTCVDPKLIDPETGRLKEASKCPPGQTDKLKAYKGTCVDPKLIDRQTGRIKEKSKCPPGQTDKLKAYKGTCVDPKLIDPQTRRRSTQGL